MYLQLLKCSPCKVSLPCEIVEITFQNLYSKVGGKRKRAKIMKLQSGVRR